ncbi:MAG: FAD-dependent oxidoreductase [Clostridiales bacterium]|nr:FAD-dependent oxidoreductase [Clostridiales bacterium]NLV85503.1 FAD-dependent oxidoreductase [Spirochaetales bacterium]
MDANAHNLVADIVVLGGGMAGISAAISAARAGCKTLIIERRTSLGGMATTGLVMPFLGVFSKGRKIIGGNLDYILQTLKDNFPFSVTKLAFDPEAMRHTLDIIADNYQIDILLDTWVTDIVMRSNTVAAVKIYNKSGAGIVTARQFIDATGDADIACMAGIPCKVGRDNDGKTQAYTLRFMMGNIDANQAQPWLNERDKEKGFLDLLETYAKRYHVPILDMHFQNFEVPGRKDVLVFNVPRIIGIDGIDGCSLSEGYRRARRIIRVYARIMRENVPGCAHAYILSTAESLGVRESRRIVGSYILTGDDVIQGKKFADAVCGNCWWIDIHNPQGKGVSEMVGPKGGHNDIPYRALFSDQVDNLWVAGRCISATHEALASARIMPTCIATGQAAGTAAAIANQKNTTASLIDISELRRKLVQDGAIITGINLCDGHPPC